MIDKIQTSLHSSYPGIILDGHDMWSKFGFRGGDVLDEYVWADPALEDFDTKLYDLCDITFFKDVSLIALVELFLLPKFDRPLTLYHANYLHNPARVKEEEWWDPYAADLPDLPIVEIAGLDAMGMLYKIKSVFEAWRNNQPVVFPNCLIQTAQIFNELTKAKEGKSNARKTN